MFAAIDAIIWEADADTLDFSFVGGSVEEILGYTPEQWLGQPDFWESKLHPEDAGWVIETCVSASRKREPHRMTYRMVAADGRAVWLQDNVKLTIREGRAILSGIMIDVTELIQQRQHTEALSERNAHFHRLYDLVPIAIWEEDWSSVTQALRDLKAKGVADLRAHIARTPGFIDSLIAGIEILSINPTAVDIFKARDAAELIRRAPEVFEANKPGSVFLTTLEAILEGRAGIEGVNRMRRLDGTPVHIMYRALLPRLYERDARVILCEMDISEAHTANERFELVTRATSDVIWDFDIVNDRLWASKELKQTFGLEPEEMYTSLEHWTARIHLDDLDRVMRHYDSILHEGVDDWEQEYRFRKGDGAYAIVRDQGFILRDEKGAATRMIGSLVDITEQRQLKERLIQAQRLESLGKFTGGIAHDFNNLLTVVLGGLDMLEDSLGDDPERQRHVASAMRAAERGIQLIDRLLAFARQQPLEPQTLDLLTQAHEIRQLIEHALGARFGIQVEVSADLWLCRADPAQLENALLNLCINSRDAMPRGGMLTIGMRNARIAEGEALAEQGLAPGNYVAVSVADTGHGMDEATLQKAFEPFFTTKDFGLGSGLGLAMVHGFAQQSHGLAMIESAPGQGTTVELFLPAIAQAQRS